MMLLRLMLCLLILLPAPSWAALALVQSKMCTAGVFDTTTCAFDTNVTAGNLLITTGATWNGSIIAAIAHSDTLTSSWSVILGTSSGSTPNKTSIAYAIAAGSGADTVTINPDASNAYGSYCIAEVSGNHSSPLDVDGLNSTGTGTATSEGITTVAADTIVIEAMTQGSGGNHALTANTGGGWATLCENENAGNAPHAAQYQIFSSAGAKTASMTIGASVPWASQTVSFKASAGGGSPPPPPSRLLLGIGK